MCAGGMQPHGGRGVLRCGLPAPAVHEVHREGGVCQVPLPERLLAALRTHHEKKQVGGVFITLGKRSVLLAQRRVSFVLA